MTDVGGVVEEKEEESTNTSGTNDNQKNGNRPSPTMTTSGTGRASSSKQSTNNKVDEEASGGGGGVTVENEKTTNNNNNNSIKKILNEEDEKKKNNNNDRPRSVTTNNNSNHNNNNNTKNSSNFSQQQQQQQQPKLGDKLPICECMTGMIQDVKARLPIYMDDWRIMPPKQQQQQHSATTTAASSYIKICNATLFAFVVQLIPALIFAELLDKQTSGSLAVAEVLLSAGIIGILYALICGQPLVLLGITGPVAILLGTSYGLAEKFHANYFPFFWWLCMWTSVLHLLTAMIGLVNFVWQITPFSSQIFEFFIAMSFIYESIRDLVEPIHLTSSFSSFEEDNGQKDNNNGLVYERAAGYANLVIGICTFYICWSLHFAETWVYGTREVRTFLTSYNMMIAVVIMTALSYLPGVAQDGYEDGVDAEDGSSHGHGSRGGIVRVHIRSTPWNWQPTAENPTRSWITDPFDGIDAEGIFGALIPAVMLYLLFFIDHNISSILTQAPKFNLTKPPSYHWDFFCLGLTIIPCGILGLPPGSGLIPQAPLHTRALCTREHKLVDGVKREIVTRCEEQRWSALLQASLMFVALSSLVVISWIPVGCLFGVFLYLGVGAMYGNEIWERIALCFMLPKKRPPIPIVKNVNWRTVQLYTMVQAGSAALIFGVAQFAEVGYIFPALVAGLVPLRSMVVSRLFKDEDLQYLDPIGESEEDYQDEQHEIIEARHRAHSVDESEVFHGFSEFRPKDVTHDATEHYMKHPEAIPQNMSWEISSNEGDGTGLRRRKIATNDSIEVDERIENL